MRIAVCGTKGGSGKSTLAGLLALCLADAGRSVAVKDSDPQNTLTDWFEKLEEPKVQRKGEWLHLGTGETEFHISDFPPASPDSLLGMLGAEWELVLVPCRPALADIWSIRSWLEKLEGYKGKVRLVMNALDNSTFSKAESISRLLQSEGIKTPRTKASLSRRSCYAVSMLGGWDSLDEKAKKEVLSLALEVIK